jgi:hypothetical protein
MVSPAKSLPTTEQAKPYPLTADQFADFFAIMGGLYGHQWRSQYGDNPSGAGAAVWKSGLSSLTAEQISLAVKHYRKISISSDWPPNVIEFRRKALNIPSLAAIKLALRNSDKTPFSRLVWTHIDGHRWRNASAAECDRMAADAYTLACEAIERGEQLPVESLELAHDKEAAAKAERELYDKKHQDRLRELGAA